MTNSPWISATDQSQWQTYPAGDSSDGGSGPIFDASWDRMLSPGFLERLGWDMQQNPWVGDSGDSGGTFSLDPDLMDRITKGNYEIRGAGSQGGMNYTVFQNNKEVDPTLRQFFPYYDRNAVLGTALAGAFLMPGGIVGGAGSGVGSAMGLTGNTALGVNAAVNAGMAAAGEGAEDRDIGKAMLMSAGGSFLPNMGEYVGIDNPYLQRAFNGAVTGAAQASAADGDVGVGAASGAIPGLASYVGGVTMDQSYVPTSSGQNLLNELRGTSGVPRNNLSSFTDVPQTSSIPSYVPQGSPMSFSTPRERASSGFQMPDLDQFFGKLVPNSPEQWGNFAEGLGGLLMGGMQFRRARQLEKQLGARRGAYEENLRRNLTRRDAASGRRSNYAGRETQLQASLAELDSRNMPGMLNLNNQQFAGLADMFRSGLRYAGKQGMFGDRFTPGYREQSSIPPSSFMLSTLPMSTDVNNFDQFIGGARLGEDPYRRRTSLGGI